MLSIYKFDLLKLYFWCVYIFLMLNRLLWLVTVKHSRKFQVILIIVLYFIIFLANRRHCNLVKYKTALTKKLSQEKESKYSVIPLMTISWILCGIKIMYISCRRQLWSCDSALWAGLRSLNIVYTYLSVWSIYFAFHVQSIEYTPLPSTYFNSHFDFILYFQCFLR